MTLPSLSLPMTPSLQSLRFFDLGSGARLNLKKCKGLWVGAWQNCVSGPVDIRWSSVKLHCLGSFLGPCDLSHDNWDPRIQALKNLFLG